MIQLNNVSFAYGNNSVILNKVNFTFHERHCYALKGSNGVGKTTLIKLLLGLLSPSSGRIDLPADVTISYLPDNNGVYEYLTVMQNIQFRLGIYNIPFTQCKGEVEELLQLFEMLNYVDTPVAKLSLGTKKKAAIICALIVSSDILILDEPTAGLDEDSSEKLLQFLLYKRPLDSLVICITHDQAWLSNCKFDVVSIQNKEVCLCPST